MNPKSMINRLVLTLMILGTLSAAGSLAHDAEAAGPGVRPAAVESENGYYYTVQKGDTLWDLSRRFSATPWVWPELWEENSETIANPHLIFPGQKIRLARMKGIRPAGTPAAGDAEPAVDGIHYYFSTSDQYGFIRRVPVAPEGVIFKLQDAGKQMISEGDIVYIRPDGRGVLSQGQRLTIYRTFEPLTDPKTQELVGTQHLLCGVLEIVQREPQYAVAKVLASYRPIKTGDLLMPYQRRSPRIAIQNSQPGIDAKLILAEEHLSIFAESHVAFINQGQRHGIRPGQIYSIYRQDEHRFDSDQSPQAAIAIPIDFGELLVLHTEEDTATVLITDSKKESSQGTRVRTPLALR